MSLDTLLGRPTIEKTPSGLRRITRFKKLDPAAAKVANVETYFLAYGTADSEFPLALLVEQRIDRRAEQGAVTTLIQVYQELADNALTATTEVTETTTFDGRRVTRTTYLCKASQAAALRPAIGSGSPAIFQVDISKNGPVAQLVTYAIEITNSGFVLSQTDETRNDGKLLLRNIRTVGAAPSTPVGYVLVSSGTQNVDGYTVYNYQFAKGDGEISRSRDLRYNGMLERITIRHLTASSVGTQPTSDPLSGGILVSEDRSDQDGYRIWTVTWTKASGTALIRDDVETKYNGKLKIYRRSRFNAVPAAPAPTIGGTVTLISSGSRLEDGFTIYDSTWAEGLGRIALDVDSKQGGALTISTVRYFDTDDGAAPAGTVVSTSTTKQDGLDLTTKVYASGSGEISRDTDSQLNGLLQRVTIRHLTSIATGTQPTVDPLSGGSIVSQARTDQDGYRIWIVVWAKGSGTAVSETISREDGSLVYDVVTLSDASATPSYPGTGTGYLVSLTNEQKDGHWVNRARWIKPPTNYTRPVQVEFRKPGLVVAGNPPNATPPVTLDLMGTETVTYTSTPTAAVPYKISSYATLYETYIRASDGYEYSKIEPLPGYLGSGTTVGTNTTYRGVDVDAFSIQVAGSNPTSLPTGIQTLGVRVEKYLTAINGTVVWRNAVVTADVT